MDIAQVAKRSGLTAATLRYYEEKGLIRSVGRDGLRRRFDPRVLDQLALIGLGQAAGFTLEQIGTMFDPGGGTSIDRKLLSAKADEIDGLVARLQAVSKGLRHEAAYREYRDRYRAMATSLSFLEAHGFRRGPRP